MELTQELIAVQGILISTQRRTVKDFSTIKHLEENKKEIALIVYELERFLDSIPNGDKKKESLYKITYFLLLNTKFKHEDSIEKSDCFHLVNIVPQLSTCLFVNLIYGLNLSSSLGDNFEGLPLNVIHEILQEFLENLKFYEAQESLQVIYCFAKDVIAKLSKSDSEGSEDIDRVMKLLLQYLSGIDPRKVTKWDSDTMYLHIGNTFLCLLKLLLCCELDDPATDEILNSTIKSSVAVMEAVTLPMFSMWSKIKVGDDQVLQRVISARAYSVVEKFKDYEPAQKLVGMLRHSNVAQEPESLSDRISKSTLDTIVSNVDRADSNQKQWFNGLLRDCDVLKEKKSLQCIERWAHLCDLNYVTRLLRLAMSESDQKVKNLVVKCTYSLSREEVIIAMTRYFFTYGIESHIKPEEDVKQELVLSLNKSKNEDAVHDDFIKTISCLVLQNSKALGHLYSSCIKNDMNSKLLQPTLKEIAVAVNAQQLSTAMYIESYRREPPKSENIQNHIVLLTILLETEHVRIHKLMLELFNPILEEYLESGNFESITYTLQLLNGVSNWITPNHPSTLTILSKILKRRNTFYDFSPIRHEALQEIINFLEPYKGCNVKEDLTMEDFLDDEIRLNNFHINNLFTKADIDVITYVFPDLGFEDHDKVTYCLVKILPVSTLPEWKKIVVSLRAQCGYDTTIELLTTVMILLCQVLKNPEVTRANGSSLLAMRSCLRNYGIIIKDVLDTSKQRMDKQVVLASWIVKLLSYLPESIKREEGLSLTTLISNDCLKYLKKDKVFLGSISSITEETLAQSLINRMY